MQTRVWIGIAALALAACAQAVQSDEASKTGSLSLALTAVDSQGKSYRLRNAVFEVYGYPDSQYQQSPPPMGGFGYGGYGGSSSSGAYYEQFKTEDDPDAEAIVTKLVPGYYNITLLNDDWYLERKTETGTERVEKAVLLTSRYQSTYVWDGGVAQVNYRFGVDGELLDFRSGELRIGIEIERPGERCAPGGYAGYPGMPYPPYPGCPAGAGGSDAAGIGGAAGVAGAIP